MSQADQDELRKIARSLAGKNHFVEIAVYPNPAEQDSDAEFKSRSLAFARAQQTATFLVDQGKIQRRLVRIVVAADDELSEDDHSQGQKNDVNTVKVFTYEKQRMSK